MKHARFNCCYAAQWETRAAHKKGNRPTPILMKEIIEVVQHFMRILMVISDSQLYRKFQDFSAKRFLLDVLL